MMIVSPAYGRDYKSAKAVRADWDAEKDFIIETFTDPYCGKPVNKQQIPKGEGVQVRFARMAKVTMVQGGGPHV